MKHTRLNRVLSLFLALVLCAGMVPATAIPVSAAAKEVFKDDFSAYFTGTDTFWQNTNYTNFQSKYHNAVGSESYATYGIVTEEGNKMLELVAVNTTCNYFETRDKISGERGFTVDIKFPTPLGPSVPGVILNPFVGQSFPQGFAMFYIDALGDVKIYETTTGTTNQIKMDLRPELDTWYTVKGWVTKGQLMLKMWPKGKEEPADTAGVENGVIVFNSPVFDDGFLSGNSRLWVQSRSRNRPGEAYTVLMDNLTMYGTPVGDAPGVIPHKLTLPDASVGKNGIQLAPILSGAQIEKPVYSWTSSDPSIVSVTADGKAVALKNGTVTVTVNLLNADGTVAASASGKVDAFASGIDGTSLAKQYEVGDTVTLKLNNDASNVKWTSSDLSVATADASGTVTCKARGSAVITATWTEDGVTLSDKITLQVGAPTMTMKYLAIGDDYSIDTAYYLKKLDRVYPDVNFEVAILHAKEISVQGHARNANNDAAAYALYTPDANGNLVKSRDNVRISEMLEAEKWDIVSVGSHSFLAGYDAAYRTDMQYMVDYLHDNEPGAMLWWPVAWSFADGYDPYGIGVNKVNSFSDYWENSAWMYNAIIRCTNRHILGRSDWFDFTLPTGVAVQNLRAALGRDLTRDGDRLSNKTGRLTAGLTLFYGLCLNMGYAPDLSLLNENTVNFLVDGEAKYPDKDYKASDLPKIADAVKAAYADMSDRKLTEIKAPAFVRNTEPGAITVEQVQAPSALRFPDLKKLPDGRLVAVYTDNPTHGVDKGNPILLGQSVRLAISEDNGETWTAHELFDLEKAAVEMNAPGLEGIYDRYETLKKDPSAVYVVGGMGNDSELLPVKMDLNNDGKPEDALLYSACFYNVNSDTSHKRYLAMCWISLEDLDGWLAGKVGKEWSDFQFIINDSKRGDSVQFDDGSMLFTVYGSNTVRVLDMTFDPETQQWVWSEERNVPNLSPENDWTTSTDAFNEFSLISPDGTDKIVYGLARSSGIVLASRDRGRSWELVANEAGTVQQPQFTLIDTNRAFATWSNQSDPRETEGKVFYFDAGWEETETRIIYSSPDKFGQDAADPSCAYTDDGTVLTIQYDTGYLSIVGVKDDPNSEEFLPNTLTTKELITVTSADSVTLGSWTADKRPEKSFIMEFDLTLNDTNSVVQALMRTDVGVKFSTKGITCLEDTCLQNTALTPGTKYSVKVAAVGKMLWGKIWAAGSAEPGWSIWCTDHVNKSLTTAASLSAASGAATVEKVSVKIPAMLDMEQSVTALSSDFPRAIVYDRYNTEGTMVWTSSDPNVASVDQDGLLTFKAAGETTVTVTLGQLTRTVRVTVNPAPAELTGAGEKKVFQSEDFSSYPVGDNSFYAYLGADKAFATTSPGNEPGSGYSIVEENGNKFLRLYDDTNTKNPWFMSNTAVTGNYTVQFDFRTFGAGGTSLYVTMFQKDNISQHPNTAMFRLHEFAGIQIAEGQYQGVVPFDQWATAKMMCINGALYCKVWPKTESEPTEWSSIVQIPGLTTATANHVRMQVYHPVNSTDATDYLIDVDNLVISQQQVEGIEAMHDVIPGAWYYDAVNYVINNKIMSGYNANSFGPNDTLNRAMVVQVLYNKEGQPALNGLKHNYSDVPASQWFNNAVTWGSNRGVVSGFGGGVFKPEDAVTIEQVAVILRNYSGSPNGNGDLSKVGNHSDWAADALKWAVEQGILDNVPFTNATENATRAQTAQMLTNYLRAD